MSESPWPSVLLQRGLGLLEEGAPADALPVLRAALAECDGPDRIEHSAECLYWIGGAHATLEEFETATGAYRRAADLLADAPLWELPTACAEMAGRGLVMLERPAEALPYLRRAATGLEDGDDTAEQAEIGEMFGDALRVAEQYDEAMSVLRQAADRYLALDRILDAADCRESCGDVAIEQGDTISVRDEHLAARELFAHGGEAESVALCSYVIAKASAELGDTATAEREFGRARTEAIALGNHAGAAECGELLAELYLADGRTAEGSAALSAAGSAHSAAGDYEHAAANHWRASELMLRAGRYDTGISSYTTALDELLAAGHPELVAAGRLGLGMLLQNCGRLSEATDAFARARDYYESASMPLDVAECDTHLATILFTGERIAEADVLLRSATAAFDEHRDDPRYAQALRYSAVLQEFRGSVTQARATLAEARRYAAASGSQDAVRACMLDEARLILNNGGDLPAAFPLLEEARASAERDQEWPIAAQCIEFTGLCQLRQERYAEAEATLTRARDAYELLGLPTQVALVELHLGHVYSMTGRFAAAEAAIARWRATAKSLDIDRNFAVAENMIGAVHLKAGRYPAAAEAFRAAAASLDQAGQPFQAAVSRLNLGAAVMLQREFSAGIALMTASIEVLGADPFYRLYRASGLTNLGVTEVYIGRAAEGVAHLTQARELYAELGIVVAMAKAELMVALADSVRGGPQDQRGALARALPAMVFIDAQRFAFADAHARISWSVLHAEVQKAVFDWAFRLGDTTLMADLIETAINSGTHVAERVAHTREEGDLQVTLAALSASEAEATEADASQAFPAGGAAALISGAILPMRPPPRLRMPDGHVALAEHLAVADARYRSVARHGEVRVW
ncbi:hypothetical protein [Nocardia sp. NPDC004722]